MCDFIYNLYVCVETLPQSLPINLPPCLQTPQLYCCTSVSGPHIKKDCAVMQTRVIGAKYGKWGKQNYGGWWPVKTDQMDWYVKRCKELRRLILAEQEKCSVKPGPTAFVTFRCATSRFLACVINFCTGLLRHACHQTDNLEPICCTNLKQSSARALFQNVRHRCVDQGFLVVTGISAVKREEAIILFSSTSEFF